MIEAMHVQVPMSNVVVAVNHPCQRCGQVLQLNIMCTVQLHGMTPTGHWHFDCTPAPLFMSPPHVIRPLTHLDEADRVRMQHPYCSIGSTWYEVYFQTLHCAQLEMLYCSPATVHGCTIDRLADFSWTSDMILDSL